MKRRRESQPTVLAEVLAKLMQKRSYARTLSHEQVAEAWERAAGKDLAKSARVAHFRGGILSIEVSSAALRYELEAFRGAELLSRLGADPEAPQVRRLAFKVSS